MTQTNSTTSKSKRGWAMVSAGLFILGLSTGHWISMDSNAQDEVFDVARVNAEFARLSEQGTVPPAQVIDSVTLSNPDYFALEIEGNGFGLARKDDPLVWGLGSMFLADSATELRQEVMSMWGRSLVESLPRTSYVAFEPAQHTLPNATVGWVFKDFTCPFCAQMHQSKSEYLDLGVEMRYLPIARDWHRVYQTGEGDYTQSALSLIDAWCADDPASAIDLYYKNGIASDLTEPACESGVEALVRSHEIYDRLQLQGTPSWIFTRGAQQVQGAGAASPVDLLEFAFGN